MLSNFSSSAGIVAGLRSPHIIPLGLVKPGTTEEQKIQGLQFFFKDLDKKYAVEVKALSKARTSHLPLLGIYLVITYSFPSS